MIRVHASSTAGQNYTKALHGKAGTCAENMLNEFLCRPRVHPLYAFHSAPRDAQPARGGPLIEQANYTPLRSGVGLGRSVAVSKVHHSGGQTLTKCFIV